MGDDEKDFQAWKAAKQTAPTIAPSGDDAEFDAWKASQAPKMPTKLAIAKRNAAAPHPEDLQDAEPSYAQKALGGLAAFGKDIPGVEAVQAGARSFFRAKPSGESHFGFVPTKSDESYTDALSNIRTGEDAAPKFASKWNSIGGGTIAALAGPKGGFANPLRRAIPAGIKGTQAVGSAAAQGARYGAAQGLLSADPMSNEDRLLKAGKSGAVAAAIAGLVGDVIPKGARILKAKPRGETAQLRDTEIANTDAANYNPVLQQAKGASHPQATAAFNNPYIKPYVDAARESPSLAGADDATILHETYTRLGTRQRALEAQTEHAASHLAGPEREIKDIELAKRQLLDAAEKLMPGYKKAVEQHAKLAGEYDSFVDAGDQANRIIRKAPVAGKNLLKNSADAFKASIIQKNKAQAEAAREAVLGQLHEKAGDYLNAKPWRAFGIPKVWGAANRISPYLQQLDEQISGPANAASGSFRTPANAGILRNALAAAIGANVGH